MKNIILPLLPSWIRRFCVFVMDASEKVINEHKKGCVVALILLLILAALLVSSVVLEPKVNPFSALLSQCLNLIIGALLGLLATWMSNMDDPEGAKKLIIDHMRSGIENVHDEGLNVPLFQNTAADCRKYFYLFRSFVKNSIFLPTKEIEDAMNIYGASIIVILPTEDNSYLRDREKRLPEKDGSFINALNEFKKTLQDIVKKAKAVNSPGELWVREYDGPFTVNITGNEKNLLFSVSWSHKTAYSSPHIDLASKGALRICVENNFEKIWRGSVIVKDQGLNYPKLIESNSLSYPQPRQSSFRRLLKDTKEIKKFLKALKSKDKKSDLNGLLLKNGTIEFKDWYLWDFVCESGSKQNVYLFEFSKGTQKFYQAYAWVDHDGLPIGIPFFKTNGFQEDEKLQTGKINSLGGNSYVSTGDVFVGLEITHSDGLIFLERPNLEWFEGIRKSTSRSQ